MKRRLRALSCCVPLLALMAVCPGSAPGQSQAATQRGVLPDKILAFLKKMSETSKPRVRFKGHVVPIPQDLRESLELSFYLHRFTIVRMERSRDISYVESELIVVTDAKSGEVVSTLWELGVGDTPASFKDLLTHYPEANDWRAAAARLKVLADLLVYPHRDYERSMGGRVGSVRYIGREKMFRVELIKSYGPYRLLHVQVTEDGERLKFGSLFLIDPETGREQ